jgi:hypothetical protein
MPILSGVILRFKPLISGGIGCWVLSIIAMLIDNYDYQFLMIPAAMMIAWIIQATCYVQRYNFKPDRKKIFLKSKNSVELT